MQGWRIYAKTMKSAQNIPTNRSLVLPDRFHGWYLHTFLNILSTRTLCYIFGTFRAWKIWNEIRGICKCPTNWMQVRCRRILWWLRHDDFIGSNTRFNWIAFGAGERHFNGALSSDPILMSNAAPGDSENYPWWIPFIFATIFFGLLLVAFVSLAWLKLIPEFSMHSMFIPVFQNRSSVH